MKQLFDSFWRATTYCLHPRIIFLSLLPLILIAGLAYGLSYYYLDFAKTELRTLLTQYGVIATLTDWLSRFGLNSNSFTISELLPMLIIIAIATPVLLLLSLVLVAIVVTPSVVRLVNKRRFPLLEAKRGGSALGSVFRSLSSTILAIVALVLSMVLWVIPPFVLILPPLIWGWLTYRVMAYDALAVHASKQERKTLFKTHYGALLSMGVVTGYLGTAPTLIWAWGAMTIALAPILMPVAIWIYTLVFAFSSLWFTHYGLAALAQLRKQQDAEAAALAVQKSDLSINQTSASNKGSSDKPLPLAPDLSGQDGTTPGNTPMPSNPVRIGSMTSISASPTKPSPSNEPT